MTIMYYSIMEFHLHYYYFILINLIICFSLSASKTPHNDSYYTKGKDRLNTTELVRESGRECEEVEVTTEDGYVLRLFRVGRAGPAAPPVLLLHGLMDSSDTFCVRRRASPAAELARAGYDVWLGNMRGNRYSRRHVSMDPDLDRHYWDFSFHENGYYDYPAFINTILKRTGKKQVILIGHSQGSLNFFVMASSRPEYNAKVQLFIALAPIFFMQNQHGVAAAVPVVYPVAYNILTSLGQVELLNSNSMLLRFIQDECTKLKQRSYKICLDGIFKPIFGVDAEQIELGFLPVIMKQYFSGTSVKLIAHANQFVHGHYGPFDYGHSKNMEVYGTPEAPVYNLTNISTKVVLMVGRNDPVSTVPDGKRLRDALPNATYFEMPRKTFTHIDFVWGNQMTKYFFPYLHKFLNEYK